MIETPHKHLLTELAARWNLEPKRVSYTRLHGGYLNDTYLLSVDGNDQDDILWLTRPVTGDKVDRQTKAMSWLQAVGLPVPHANDHGTLQDGTSFLLMNRLPGSNLEAALEQFDSNRVCLFFKKAGRLLARLHDAKRSFQTGYLEDRALSTLTWHDWLIQRVNYWLAEIRHSLGEQDAPFDQQVLSQLHQILCEQINQLPREELYSLLHGDYYPGNLLFEENEITGLLDFEWSLFGSRDYDFRVMEVFLFPTYGQRDAFYEGYKEILPLPEGYQTRIELYKAIYRLELMWMDYALFEGRAGMIAEQGAELQAWVKKHTSKPQAVLISIGSELTEGQLSDTNSTWLAKQLLAIGIPTTQILTVPDDRSSIQAAFQSAREQANLIISTGGLGATHDDQTRQAIDSLLNLAWEEDREARLHLENLYRSWGVTDLPMDVYQQAHFPQQGTRIPNPLGTALGFSVKDQGQLFVCLPGVPREMKEMFVQTMQPLLPTLFHLPEQKVLADWMIYGTTEENVATLIQPLHQESLQTVILVDRGMVRVQVKAEVTDLMYDGDELSRRIEAVRNTLSPWIYGTDGQTVEQAFWEVYGDRSVFVWDQATGGMCSALLVQAAPTASVTSLVGDVARPLVEPLIVPAKEQDAILLRIHPFETSEQTRFAQVEFQTSQVAWSRPFELPLHYAHDFMERFSRLIAAEAIKSRSSNRA